MLAPGRVSAQETPEQPHSASDSPRPVHSMGLLFVTSEAHCITEKRKAGEVGRSDHSLGWAGRAGAPEELKPGF